MLIKTGTFYSERRLILLDSARQSLICIFFPFLWHHVYSVSYFFFVVVVNGNKKSHLPVRRKNGHQTHCNFPKARGSKYSYRSENTEKESFQTEKEQNSVTLIYGRVICSWKEICRAISQNVITINFSGTEFCVPSPNW